jgi:hypothetical protein
MEIIIGILFCVSSVFVLLGMINFLCLIFRGAKINHLFFSNATIFALSVLFQVYFWASKFGVI